MKKYLFIFVMLSLLPLTANANSCFAEGDAFKVAAAVKVGVSGDNLYQVGKGTIGNSDNGSITGRCGKWDRCGTSTCEPSQNKNYVWDGTACVNPCASMSCASGYSKVLSDTGCCCK